MSNAVLQTRDLTRVFEQGGQTLTVLHNVEVEVKAGEMVALVGPSGAGKSTFLQAVGLLDKPTSGDIYIGGELASSMKDDVRTAMRRNSLGFVYQFHLILVDYI